MWVFRYQCFVYIIDLVDHWYPLLAVKLLTQWKEKGNGSCHLLFYLLLQGLVSIG